MEYYYYILAFLALPCSLVVATSSNGTVDWWPRGSYALLSTPEGCPHTASDTMRNRSTIFIATSRSPSSDDKTPNGIGGFRYDDQKIVVFSFCQNNDHEKKTGSSGPMPKGSYCVHAAPKCPEHFRSNSLVFQVRESFQTFGVHAFCPIILGQPALAFCCRNDGDASVPVVLPNTKPFYLYRHGGQCQKVAGTTVTGTVMDIIALATARRSSVYVSGWSLHPDSHLYSVVRFKLCYYKPVING